MTKNDLIEQNMKLVYYIISKDYPTFIRDEDIIQSGMLGLCKAAQNWDSTKSQFSTYACKCIRNEINQEFIRRKPYSKNLSLEHKVGTDGTLGDILPGDDDFCTVDYSDFQGRLSGLENEVLEMKNLGYRTDEIAYLLDISVVKVQKILRTIRLKWKKYYGTD